MTEKRNICITLNSLERGGAEKQSLLLAKALKPFHKVILVIIKTEPRHASHLQFIYSESLDHIFLRGNTLKKCFRLSQILKERKTEILFSFLPTDTIMGAICGKISNVPYRFGGIRNSFLPKIKFVALRLAHNHLLHYTISNNYAAYQSAIDIGFNKNVIVIPNGIEIRSQNIKTRSDQHIITIISLGRLVKQKSFDTALKSIDSLKKLLDEEQKIQYLIVGQGPEEIEVVSLIKKYDLSNEVKLIKNPSNIYSLLEASDIYLSSSLFEGVSNAIMEAMNCALPIIATDAGDNSRLVIHGENGFITALKDSEAIAGHLKYLIDSPSARKQMGQAGYEHLIREYSYEAFQRRYLNIINNIDKFRTHEGSVLY